MPDQPEVANTPNHLAVWQSSDDPLTRDLLDMGGPTVRVSGRCNSAARWELSCAVETPLNLQASPPAYHQMIHAISVADFPASPLCTISPLFSELTQHDCRGAPSDTRRDSEAFQDWELLSRCADNSDFAMVRAGTGERVIADESGRRRIWSSDSDMRDERRVQQCELEKRRVMEVFEKGQPKGDRKERRKVQNRQAQRTFWAKLKMRNKEVAFASPTSRGSTRCRRSHLAQLIPLVDRLERENTLLKTGQPSVFRTI